MDRTRTELWAKEKLVAQLREEIGDTTEKLERKAAATPAKGSKAVDSKAAELEAKLKDARAELAMVRSGIEAKDKAFQVAQEQEKKVVDQLRSVNRALEERLKEASASKGSGSVIGDKSLQAQLTAANIKLRDLQEGTLQVLEVSLASTKQSLSLALEDVSKLAKENATLKEQSAKKIDQMQSVNRMVSF